MLTKTLVNFKPKRVIETAWLRFQRSAMAALEEGNYECAWRIVFFAHSLTKKMAPNDPRTLITLETLAEVAERKNHIKEAIFWTNKLLEGKFCLLGPSESVIRDLRRMIRLTSREGNWVEANRYATWSAAMEEALSGAVADQQQSREAQSETLSPAVGLRSVFKSSVRSKTSLLKRA